MPVRLINDARAFTLAEARVGAGKGCTALVGVTLLPWAWGSSGLLYLASALALGAVFVWLAERLRRETTSRRAVFLFHYSLLYLALLFAALALDLVL